MYGIYFGSLGREICFCRSYPVGFGSLVSVACDPCSHYSGGSPFPGCDLCRYSCGRCYTAVCMARVTDSGYLSEEFFLFRNSAVQLGVLGFVLVAVLYC